MHPMRVLRLVVHAPTRQPVLLLGEVDGERCVPVFLRQPQADVIALGPRSEDDVLLTQDLLGPVVRGLGRSLDRVEITELRDGAFYADLVFDSGTRIAARPSDALAVAVRDGVPISMAAAILDDVGQPIAGLFPHGGDAPPEEQLREFRQFVDDVSPEDFEDPPARP
ncbi:MAG: bifunctional nuclease family protein [Geodermatophilaceae bacterium]|nr:bifunctional nuclease family protein [Geodermatophilaceae bacterium]